MNSLFRPVLALGLVGFVLLNSCAKNEEEADPRGIENRPDHGQITGSLENNALELTSDEYFIESKCGQKSKDTILTIARELDRRQPEILAISQKPVDESSSRFRNVKLGHFNIRELKSPKLPEKGWLSEKTSWQELKNLYESIQQTPTNSNWATLDSWFRSIIWDDQSFYLYGKNSFLDKDSPPMVAQLLQLVSACQLNADCETLELGNLEPFVKAQPYYHYFHLKLANAEDKEAKRAVIARFERRLKADNRSTGFTPNELVVRNSQEEFLLPLDGKVFAGIESLIEKIIADIWQEPNGNAIAGSPAGKLKILWTESEPKAFRFVLSPEQGRAFVSYDEKIIQIFANPRKTTFAHEIGHVLGLKDNYFTVWNEETCEYTSWYREDDVMSDHEVGLTLPEHWEQLRQHYSLKK
jgi:hypothetical protein